MRILIVAMTESIHTVRWIDQLSDTGWDIHVYPSRTTALHPSLKNVTVHMDLMQEWEFDRSVRLKCWPIKHGRGLLRRALTRYWPSILSKSAQLARVIRRIKPDVIHSLEIQHAGYLTLEARSILNAKIPPWIVTNWGSDVYFFGRLPSHADKVKQVLAACDWYSCECHRDVTLARQLGLRAPVLPVFPNAGGLDLNLAKKLRSAGPVSGRRWVILKGYQNWAGRAQVALRALEMCARELQNYQIAMYSAHGDIGLSAEMFTQRTGIPITIVEESSHQDILSWFGRSRMYLGLSASDGICTSMLEAMAMGAFPVQSNTACADEWLQHGKTGMIVPPEDPQVVAEAIRQVLTNDSLVDSAAEINYNLAANRLDRNLIQPMAIELYQRVLNSSSHAAARKNLPLAA